MDALDASALRRQPNDARLPTAAHATLARLQVHWLLLVNLLLGALIGVAALVPLLYALGAMEVASRIFAAHHLICAQIPSHSYFLFGYQMALCSRNQAIYGALFVGSIAFRSMRGWLAPPDWKRWLLAMIPMTLDGGTQLFGWRESNWELRTLTGVIFGLGRLHCRAASCCHTSSMW
jgi:uncharacterized membrane protein